MNYFFGFLLLVLSTVCGLVFSKKYVYKRKFYSDFYDFNKSLKNEVSFSQNTIINVIKNFNFISPFFEYSLNKKFIKAEKEVSGYYLKKDEKDYLQKYVNIIGESDKKTQLDYLSVVDKQLLENLSNCKIEEEKYKKLYVKLGFLIGLICFIVLL